MRHSRKIKYVIAPTIMVAGLILGASVSAQAATLAPVMDTPNTIAVGNTGTVGAKVVNQFGTAQTGNVKLTLTAPPNSTFTTNQVTGTNIIQGVRSGTSSIVFSNCTLANGNTVMVCGGTVTIPAAGNGKASALDFTTPILVNASAASDTLYTADTGFQLTNSDNQAISGGTTTLEYQTPVVLDGPIVNPVIGAGALGVLGVIGAAWVARRRLRV